MKQKRIELIFQPSNLRIKIPLGLTILQAAQRSGIYISSVCGGNGTCGKCKVKVERGLEGLNSPTKREIQCLSVDEIEKKYGLHVKLGYRPTQLFLFRYKVE